jgi:hypothetical protein
LDWLAAVGIIAMMALGLNLSNSLGAIAGRADSAVLKRVEKNRDIRAAEAELKRLTDLRDAMSAFQYTDAAAVEKAVQMADAATVTRKTACPESKKPNEYCREKQTAEAAANKAAKDAAEAKAQTDRAKQLEVDAKLQRGRLEQLGPLVTVNVQGSAIARLFRLQDSEVEFAATAQQFGLAAVVELIIIACLSAWEVLGHTQVITTATGDGPHSATRPLAPTIADVATAPKDIVEPIAPPPQSAPIALPRPKPRLVSDQPPAGDVNDYVIARLEAAIKHQLEFSGTYRDYEAWRRNCAR